MLLSSSGVNQPAKWAQVPSVSLKNPARLGGLPERGQNLVTPQHSLSWGVSDKLEYDFFTQVNAHCSVRGTGQSQCHQFTFYSRDLNSDKDLVDYMKSVLIIREKLDLLK